MSGFEPGESVSVCGCVGDWFWLGGGYDFNFDSDLDCDLFAVVHYIYDAYTSKP